MWWWCGSGGCGGIISCGSGGGDMVINCCHSSIIDLI